MKNFWLQLQERERWMLTLAILITTIYALYLIVLAPLSNAVSQKYKILTDKKTLLTWMTLAEKKNPPQQNIIHMSSAKLPSLLTDSLKKNKLSHFPYQIQQNQHDLIQLSFNEVPFNPFIQWLMNTCKNQNIEVQSLSAEKSATAGIVRLSVELKVK